MTFPESKVAHKWIDPIETQNGKGVEFGPAAHNPFGFRNCIFADREAPAEGSEYYKEQMRLSGRVAGTHVTAALGERLPFEGDQFDYIVTSHVLEHVWDLIACFDEMKRVLKPYGLMVHILPHVDRTFDRGRPLTTWAELQERHAKPEKDPHIDCHHSVFRTESFLSILSNIPYIDVLEALDVDDKVGNGFLVVLQLRHSDEEVSQLKAQGPYLGQMYSQYPRLTGGRAISASAVRSGAHRSSSWLSPQVPLQVGRNTPCPCGSGRRYKECHGKLA